MVPSRRRRDLLLGTAVVLLLVALVSAIGYSVYIAPYQNVAIANRVQCASNLRQIGLAILMYAAEPEHHGRFPDSFEEVLATQMISPEVFVCVAEPYTPVEGGPPQEIARRFFASGQCSYVYLGQGLTNSLSPDTPIAHERLTTHGAWWGESMNILFADGHVEWFPADKAPEVLKRAANTTRPATAASVTTAPAR